MENKLTKLLAVTMCSVLIAGGSAAAVTYAMNTERNVENDKNVPVSAVSQDKSEAEKDETVYVLAGADGSVQKIIVSDWIKNTADNALVSDRSELTDIENVKGDETYTMNGSNMRVWDSQGNDIYYQGSIEKALPVDLSVSYRLDGKNIAADSLAGKSGKVTIRFQYKNNLYKTVSIDGREERIYVPFAMLTGILLDNDIFRNIEVSNGKIINDGDRTIVVGLAFPGLQNNLGIAAEEFEIPEYVEIAADVKDFRMSNTVTFASNEIFNRLDIENTDSIDNISSSLDKLGSAMTQLMDGSCALYDGLCLLLEKSDELISGINKLAGGMKELTSHNDELNMGAKEVFESLLNTADSQIAAAGLKIPKLTISNYSDVLKDAVASLDGDTVMKMAKKQAEETVTNAVNSQRDIIKAAVTAAIRDEAEKKVASVIYENVEEQVLASMGMNKESYETGIAAGIISEQQQAQISAAIEAQMANDSVKAMIVAKTDEQMRLADIQAMIEVKTDEQVAELIKQNLDSQEVQDKIKEAVETAKAGAASLNALKEQLDSYNKFYTGLESYTAGVMQAYEGIMEMQEKSPALVSGVGELCDGSMRLSDGLKEFNEKGIQRLTDAVNGDLKGLVTRLQATADVSKDFKSFAGISDEMEGRVKFIYRTEAIDTK